MPERDPILRGRANRNRKRRSCPTPRFRLIFAVPYEQTCICSRSFQGVTMKSYFGIPVTLILISCILSIRAAASVLPSSVNLGLGYSRDLGPKGSSLTPIPSFSATWHLASHLAIRSSVAYLPERSTGSTLVARATSGYPRDAFTTSA